MIILTSKHVNLCAEILAIWVDREIYALLCKTYDCYTATRDCWLPCC